MLRLVFMGSDAIALPLLNWLASEGRGVAEIVAVFTQPDRRFGRGQKIQANKIKRWAESRALPIYQPQKLDDSELATLQTYAPDVALVMAYGHILRNCFIHTPRFGTFNLHTSLLPSYRGPSPIQAAITNGEKETGVTLMSIVTELDAGPIADVERVAIGSLDTALEVEAKLAAACVPLLARTLPKLATAEISFTTQLDRRATFCRKLERGDGVLDFTQPASAIAARINGLSPWPACTVEIAGQFVKIGRADVAASTVPARRLPAGTVFGTNAEGLLVATGNGVLCLRRLQRPGGRMLPAANFLRGFPIAIGTSLPSQPMPSLVANQPFPFRKI